MEITKQISRKIEIETVLALFRAYAAAAKGRIIWKSKKYYCSEFYPDTFALGMGKEPGKQITFILPMSYWNRTDEITWKGKVKTCRELDEPPQYDGSTTEDMVRRLAELCLPNL